MGIICGFSMSNDAKISVKEATSGILSPRLLIYFSKVKYFKEVTEILNDQYKDAVIIGCSSCGEISEKGVNDGLSVIAFSDNIEVKTLVMEGISQAPVVYLDKLKEMLNGCTEENTIAFEMTDGLSSSEEKVLSVLNAVFEEHNIQVVGGSAADDLSFTGTYVACNGNVYSNSSVIALIHNKNGRINIYKENIYKPTAHGFVVTKSKAKERKVFELDGKPIKKVYAEALKVPEEKISDYFMSNPLGRVIGDEISISSFKKPESDNSISFYCRVYKNSYVNILEPDDPAAVLDSTISRIKSEMPAISGTIVINCIFRTLLFKSQKFFPQFVSKLSRLGEFGGFTSYGEQINNRHVNQTMILICFE